MAGLFETAGRLREQEEQIAEGYKELHRAAVRDVEKRLAEQIANFQRLQVLSLDLLAEGVPEQFLGFGRITGEDVNLREGPGGRYPLVGKLDKGDVVIVQGVDGYWVQVQVPRGRSGYVFKDYIQQESI